MKVYLVGGAVRDQLLGYPVCERDWVVVGATPKLMIAEGYQRVGRDFPVFLHPKTYEEYALARTERKKGHGYYGFSCDFNSTVTLNEDLSRRDLTINAMAMDEKGQLFDPYCGAADIDRKILRHVSPAFAEDPVRVLRLARFAARYHHLGFKVADETRLLMYKMVENGELLHLIAERVWQEWQRSLGEKNPEVFITTLRACGALEVVIPELNALFGIPNKPGSKFAVDCGIDSLMHLKQAARLSTKSEIRFAAMLGSLGKGTLPMDDWPIHQAVEQSSVIQIKALCARLRIPSKHRKLAILVARFYLRVPKLDSRNAKSIALLFEQADAFRQPEEFLKFLLIAHARAEIPDGGNGLSFSEEKWLGLLTQCKRLRAQCLIDQGYKGVEIKEKLHQLRIQLLRSLLSIEAK